MKKKVVTCLTIVFGMFLAVTPAYAWGRKLISKSVSGSFYINNSMKYSLGATAGVTYNDSNNITQISDLSFKNVKCTPTIDKTTCTIVPSQKSKRFSGNTATYVITVRRSVMGVYADSVDYTLTYRTSDSGTPYSLEQDQDNDSMILVDIQEGEPYDIECLK